MEDLRALLRQALQNPAAEFKPGQEEAIRAVLEPPFRALVVQATGWGKSAVYFIATKVLRSRGRGPTLVISPLLSLMRDQLKAADRLGVRAERWTSDNRDAWAGIEGRLRADSIDLLLISPERLADSGFDNLVAATSLARVGLIVVDEAHCISVWGHDFRPDYRRIGERIKRLPRTTAALATTATANDIVVGDIEHQLGSGIRVLRGPLARESLLLQVIHGLDRAERLAWLKDHLNELPGSGIIYALTQFDTERVASWLQHEGFPVEAYHSGLREERHLLEERLLNNEVKALVATVALGMGFDKPDLGFVVHFQSPGNLVSYYQEIGRAGRAIPNAIALLMLGREDERIHEWFIEHARPSHENIELVLNALDVEPRSLPGLERCINLRRTEIQIILKTLSVESPAPIVKVGSTYQRTPVEYVYNVAEEQALVNRRHEERERFVRYALTNGCLMMAVATELDDDSARPCGRCSNCRGEEIVSSKYSATSLARATTFLKRSYIPIVPRKRWAADGLPSYGFSGNIGVALRCEFGVCLSKWGDPGVAFWVKQDKDKFIGRFRDDLVVAVVEAVREMEIANRPEWVCSVPSLRSGSLVPDLAMRVATALNVEYVNAVRKLTATPTQKSRQNSAHQCQNLDGVFRVALVRAGRVLLLDDMVDSRWTFTVLGALLRQAGSGPVVPFALSSTGHGDSDE